MSISRPALSYLGGKWKIADWVLSFFPEHNCYTESFGGAASVLLKKSPIYVEVYNDINDDIVTLFRILRDREQSAQLIEQLRLTPYSRREYFLAHEPTQDPIESVRRLIVRSFMGFSPDSAFSDKPQGFLSSASKQDAKSWSLLVENYEQIHRRFKNVTIENKDALDIITHYDAIDTLHFVDPPYVAETRMSETNYKHELTDTAHEKLMDCLLDAKGAVILAGYDNDLYNRRLKGWKQHTRTAYAGRCSKRTECLWINPRAQAKANQHTLDFGERND